MAHTTKDARATLSRQRYFDITVHHPKIKDCISGDNEDRAIGLLTSLGYYEGTDFYRQHPIGDRYVVDFAFIKEMVALEIDGKSHEEKRQKRSDKIRDRYLRENKWAVLRIKDADLFGYKGSFYRNLIREVVEERRMGYNSGELYAVDFSRFTCEEDYE